MITKKTQLFMVMSMFFLVILSACNVLTSSARFKIHFETSGGTLVKSVSYDENKPIVFPDNPTKKGYSFDGWYFDNNTFERPYTENALVDEMNQKEVTLYAKWISQDIVISELEQKIYHFESQSNQYEIEMKVDINITRNNRLETHNSIIIMQTQVDPFYTVMTSGDITTVSIVQDNELHTYTMNRKQVVNGLQLFDESILHMDEIDNSLSTIGFDLNNVNVTKVNKDEFIISGKIIDFMPVTMKKDLKDMLIESGLSEKEFNDMTIEVNLVFNNESLTYVIHIDFNINDIELSLNLEVVLTYDSFEMIDFTDNTTYFPISSHGLRFPIDISKPIVFTSDTFYITSYCAYIEAGKYGVYRNNKDVQYFSINLSSQNKDKTLFRVFNEEYNRFQENPDNIKNFFYIPTDGYYNISIQYPLASEPYIIELRKIEPVTDGIEQIDFVVTESDVFNYEIESMYDFVSFRFDLDIKALVIINDSNNNHLYWNKADEPLFSSFKISLGGNYRYVTEENSIFYLHSPNGFSSGTLTIEVIPIVHAILPDESMLNIGDQFSDDFLVTGYQLPIQYIGIEVTERKQYTFEFLMMSGTLSDVKGSLYKVDGIGSKSIGHNDSVNLMPGFYYFKSSNTHASIYSVRTVIKDIVETAHQIDFLQSYDQFVGSPQQQPKFLGSINHLGEFVIYYFTLDETKDIMFFQDSKFELYDSMSNRIDIINQSERFIYRLEAGDYFIVVTYPDYYTESNFPVNYTLILYEFTGGGQDTSVYPFNEVIPFGHSGKTSTRDYDGDYDGYTFTLTKAYKTTIISSYDAVLIKDNRIIKRSIVKEDLILDAGTYIVMCKTYQPTWTVRVIITMLSVGSKYSYNSIVHPAILPNEDSKSKYTM